MMESNINIDMSDLKSLGLFNTKPVHFIKDNRIRTIRAHLGLPKTSLFSDISSRLFLTYCYKSLILKFQRDKSIMKQFIITFVYQATCLVKNAESTSDYRKYPFIIHFSIFRVHINNNASFIA